MPRTLTLGNLQPYQPIGDFGGLSFWPGSLTLLAAAPGVGKTSWLLRMSAEAAQAGLPAALGCFEHTADELEYRRRQQARAAVAGAHREANERHTAGWLARSAQLVLLPLNGEEDTLRSIEQDLIRSYRFPHQGPALLAIDYLQRIPMVGLTGLAAEDRRAGDAAAGLRSLARRHGWAVIAAAALRTATFREQEMTGLEGLWGDERVGYEPDRVILLHPARRLPCGCTRLTARFLKDRTGPLRELAITFFGARFYPALLEEDQEHASDACKI